MAEIHGKLLIGGLALKDLDGILDDDTEDGSDGWRGRLMVDQSTGPLLEVGRDYRLELDDGRAGRVVVLGVGELKGAKIRIEIEGRSPLSR
jgi:hypothetical protein